MRGDRFLEMQTDEHTSWIRAAAIRPDDRVRLPYGSRRVFWSREDAESFDAPFRDVRRCVRGLEAPGTVTFVCRDGFRGSYPLDAFVLRLRMNGTRA